MATTPPYIPTLSPCAKAFIIYVLCGNPVVKGSIVTTLTGLVAALSLQIDLIIIEIGILNIFSSILNLEILTLKAVLSKTSAELNLMLGPLGDAATCPEIAKYIEMLQRPLTANKKVRGLINKLYKYQKALNLINVQDALKQKVEAERAQVLYFIDQINTLCP